MDSHEPDFIVAGEKVALGPLRRDLAAAYAGWMNQLDVRRGLDQMGIAAPQSQEKWVEANIERGAKREPEAVEFTVYDRGDAAPVTSSISRRSCGEARYSHGHVAHREHDAGTAPTRARAARRPMPLRKGQQRLSSARQLLTRLGTT
jgi:hypothetical protein